MSVSVGDLLLMAGVRAAQYAVDTGQCLFCATPADDVHEEHCDFHGRTRDDMVRMLAIMAACGHEVVETRAPPLRPKP